MIRSIYVLDHAFERAVWFSGLAMTITHHLKITFDDLWPLGTLTSAPAFCCGPGKLVHGVKARRPAIAQPLVSLSTPTTRAAGTMHA